MCLICVFYVFYVTHLCVLCVLCDWFVCCMCFYKMSFSPTIMRSRDWMHVTTIKSCDLSTSLPHRITFYLLHNVTFSHDHALERLDACEPHSSAAHCSVCVAACVAVVLVGICTHDRALVRLDACEPLTWMHVSLWHGCMWASDMNACEPLGLDACEPLRYEPLRYFAICSDVTINFSIWFMWTNDMWSQHVIGITNDMFWLM